MNGYWLAVGLTLFAGMATGIGSIIAFSARRTNYRFLSVATGFSAGVMLYVSFVEIFFKGVESLTACYGDYWGQWVNVASFFGGIALIGCIDTLIPAAENPHEPHSDAEVSALREPHDRAPAQRASTQAASSPDTSADTAHAGTKKLMRMGLFTAVAITIHNFPEGLATFLSALQDPELGVAIAIAIALHNIPEGISVSVPIFYATGNRGKAFLYSLLSGVAEPFGAVIAFAAISLFLSGDASVMPPQIMGILFAAVAGIMVYISLDELLPTSRAYGKGHDSLFGLLGGMAVMAISLLLM